MIRVDLHRRLGRLEDGPLDPHDVIEAVAALLDGGPCAPGRAGETAEEIVDFVRSASATVPGPEMIGVPESLFPSRADPPEFLTRRS